MPRKPEVVDRGLAIPVRIVGGRGGAVAVAVPASLDHAGVVLGQPGRAQVIVLQVQAAGLASSMAGSSTARAARARRRKERRMVRASVVGQEAGGIGIGIGGDGRAVGGRYESAQDFLIVFNEYFAKAVYFTF